MSRPVSVNIPHALGKEEARRRIANGFSTMEQQMTGRLLGMTSFAQRWEGDRLHFEGGVMGQKVSGRLEILASSIEMQIDLPEILATIADRIKGGLNREVQKLLERK